MNTLELSVLAIYLLWNVMVFLLYGADKRKAKHRQWRISESVLLGAAVLMGGVGAWLGMSVFRHKTKHLKFKIVARFAVLFNISVVIAVIYMIR